MNEHEITFESVLTDHFTLLHKWIQDPLMCQWCDKDKFIPYSLQNKTERESKKGIYPFIIKIQGNPIGFIQYYNAFGFTREGFDVHSIWDNKNGALAALDFYIGDPAYIESELIPKIVRNFLQNQVFKQYDACLVDPKKNNKTALKAYAKAGFSTVKELPSTVIMIARKIEQRHPLIIFGSSRSDGDTLQAVNLVIKSRSVPIIDLKNLNIAHYDYNYENKHDDFITLAEKMVQHNPIILATPVYWYTMSALMKTFIDRWSDLLDIRKDLGYRLPGKELLVIASYGTSIPKGFEDAFSQTCAYMDMQYKGCFYFYSGDDVDLVKNNELLAEQFSHQIFCSKNPLNRT